MDWKKGRFLFTKRCLLEKTLLLGLWLLVGNMCAEVDFSKRARTGGTRLGDCMESLNREEEERSDMVDVEVTAKEFGCADNVRQWDLAPDVPGHSARCQGARGRLMRIV